MEKKDAGTGLSVCNFACFLLFSLSGIGSMRFQEHLGNLKMFGFSASVWLRQCFRHRALVMCQPASAG